MVFKTGKGQNFDLMIVFTVADSDELFVVFIDERSGQREVCEDNNTNTPEGKAKLLDVKQFNRFVKRLKTLQERGDVKLSAISKALVEGRYRFVCMTTHAKVGPPEDNEKMVVMNAEQSKNFFGVIWDWYQAARAVKDAVIVQQKKSSE